jgi:hypothetical protein
MSPTEIAAILALTGYAVYKQTRTSEVATSGRFKIAIIYGIVALCVGGFVVPRGYEASTLLAASLLLSVVVGLARGLLTPIWIGDDGRVMRRGTALTVGLFLAMVAAKFAMGAYAWVTHVPDGAGFGEVMAMIAVMVAVQAEIVHRRAGALDARALTAGPTALAQ